MTRRHLVLVVSAHEGRLAGHHAALAAAGRWWILPAPTAERAAALLRKVRPALVLYDIAAEAAGADGGGTGGVDGALSALHCALHERSPHADAHLTVLGPLAPAAAARLARVSGAAECAHCARCPHCGRAYPDAAGAALVALLGRILDAPPGAPGPA